MTSMIQFQLLTSYSMAIIKPGSRIEEYRLRARFNDINEMSGRTGREDLTKFVSQSILDELGGVSGVLVDIGCGDGTVLRLASEREQVIRSIGILPTNEEVTRLKSTIDASAQGQKIEVIEGLSASLPLQSSCADAVVINGVLHLLSSKEDVEKTLAEIRRIIKVGGTLFLGEIPSKDESRHANKYGDSVVQWLFFILKQKGLREFLVKSLWVVKCVLGHEDMLIKPKNFMVFNPDEFVTFVVRFGFEIIKMNPHKEIAIDGSVRESESRIDYLLIAK